MSNVCSLVLAAAHAVTLFGNSKNHQTMVSESPWRYSGPLIIIAVSPSANSPIVELVQEIPSPNGETISKVVRVNSCHGIVVEHALYKHNRLIASARLGNHRIDEATGIVTPRTIRLDWPDDCT